MLTRPSTVRDGARRAAEVGRERLLDLQHTDGSWEGIVRCDPTVTGLFLLSARYVSRLDPEIEAPMLAYLDRTQLPGGGWAAYPGGPASLDATLLGYMALRFAGRLPDSEPMRRARRVILGGGGVEAVGFIPRASLAFWGQIPLSGLTYLSPKLLLLPRWIHPNLHDLGILLQGVLPMELLLKHHAAKQPVAGPLEELQTGRDFPRAVMSRAGAAISRLSRFLDEVLPAPWLDRRVADWLAQRQNSDGLWAGMALFTARVVMALHAIDPVRYRAHIDKGMAGMIRLQVPDRDGTRWQAMARSSVVDTAIAVAALLDSGLHPGDSRVARALDWLLAARGTSPAWSFTPGNARTPDTDTTLHVLEALARAPRSWTEIDDAIDAGARWLLTMQDRSGGWAMWSPGLRIRRSLVRELEINGAVDVSTPDVTARVVRALVRLRGRTDSDLHPRIDAAMARALAYLHRTQQPDGSWPGRWAVNFIYGTAQGLTALRAAGEHGEAARRARKFLHMSQQDDGGWGESPASDDVQHAVPAASTATQTALGLLGLASEADHDGSIKRAATFLVERQRNGGWEDIAFCQTLLPGRLYFQNSLLATSLAVMALSRVAWSDGAAMVTQ